MDDAKLIRLFSDLTGESDGAGRSVLMYLDILGADYFPNQSGQRQASVQTLPDAGQQPEGGSGANGKPSSSQP
jgi:hypothetical protein